MVHEASIDSWSNSAQPDEINIIFVADDLESVSWTNSPARSYGLRYHELAAPADLGLHER